MSKHFGKFTTEVQYTAGLSSLDFPNVSLVEQTGNVHYSVAVGPKQIWEAEFGDILFYDVDRNTLMTLANEDYNTTDFPVAKYEPIAICVFDKASYDGDKTVFMSLKWMSCTNPEEGNAKCAPTPYGFYNYDLSANISNIRSSSYVDTIALNNSVKNLVTEDWSGETIPVTNLGEGSAPAFECCWRFHTNGTSAGQWYLPTRYDMSKYFSDSDNRSQIFDILTSIKEKAGSSIINTVSNNGGTSYGLTATENNNKTALFMENLNANGTYRFAGKDKNANNPYMISRAVFFAGPQEL